MFSKEESTKLRKGFWKSFSEDGKLEKTINYSNGRPYTKSAEKIVNLQHKIQWN